MADRMVLGKDVAYSTDSRETGLNNNVVVIGGTGCGKTVSIAEPRILDAVESSQVITVTKQRLYKKYRGLLRQRGYHVQALNLAKPEESTCSFDPLAYVKTEADITFLATSIVKSNMQNENQNTKHNDPYWDNAAVSLLSAEIAYIMMTEENPSFADVIELHESLTFTESGISKAIKTSLDDKFYKLEDKNSNCFAVVCWRSFRQLPYGTAGCVYGVLNAVTDSMFTKDILKMMKEKPKLDIAAIGMRKTALFVLTSAVNPALHSLVHVFYARMFKELFEAAEERADGTLPIPVHVLCDDFATGGRVYNFAEYISIFREKGISATLLLQSESQLRSMYGYEEAVTIINNCDTYVYMGGMDLDTCRNLSVRANLPVEDILYLPVGDILVFRRGQMPIYTKRYDIFENKLYVQLTRAFEEHQKQEQLRMDRERLRQKQLERRLMEQNMCTICD